MPERSDLLDRRIKLRHLVCFLEVTRLKSVQQTASVLGLSQPAVSKTIHELEDILAVELFDRSRRQLVLTTFGEIFQRYAGASLTALKQGIQSLGHTEVEGSVGAAGSVSSSILPAAMIEFGAQHLDVKLRIITGPLTQLVSQLRNGEIDLVIGRMAEPEAMQGLSFEPLYTEEIALVVRPDHPLLAARAFDIGAINAYQVLLPPAGSVVRPTVDRFLVARALGPFQNEIETVSASFARGYTRATNAVWIISGGNVADDVKQGLLMRLPIDTSDTRGPIGFTTRPDVMSSLPIQLLAQSVRNVVAKQIKRDAAKSIPPS